MVSLINLHRGAEGVNGVQTGADVEVGVRSLLDAACFAEESGHVAGALKSCIAESVVLLGGEVVGEENLHCADIRFLVVCGVLCVFFDENITIHKVLSTHALQAGGIDASLRSVAILSVSTEQGSPSLSHPVNESHEIRISDFRSAESGSQRIVTSGNTGSAGGGNRCWLVVCAVVRSALISKAWSAVDGQGRSRVKSIGAGPSRAVSAGNTSARLAKDTVVGRTADWQRKTTEVGPYLAALCIRCTVI